MQRTQPLIYADFLQIWIFEGKKTNHQTTLKNEVKQEKRRTYFPGTQMLLTSRQRQLVGTRIKEKIGSAFSNT